MDKAETIAYAIKKECQSYSLVDWCEEWGFSVDEFNRFLTLGQEAFYQEQTERSEEIQGLDFAENILENILREQEGDEE